MNGGQLCDWCNGGRECVCAVHDGRCSPWVMCSEVSGNQIHDRAPPPQRAASRRFTHTRHNPGGRWSGGGTGGGNGGPGPCGANETGAHQGRADEDSRDVKGYWVDRCDVR